MTDGGDEGTGGDGAAGENDSADASPAHPATREEVAALRDEVEALEADLEARTVPRAEVEADLRRYVRERLRRGHARGWGPYLVLLYGTAMTLGAFYFLSGGWAILAMVVIWLSTLGLYTLMLIVGAILAVGGAPRRVVSTLRDWRS